MKIICKVLVVNLLLVGLITGQGQARADLNERELTSVASGSSGEGGASGTGNLTGTVSDSTNGRPLDGAEVIVSQAGTVVADVPTDEFGRFTAHNLPAGDYTAQVRFVGFGPATRPLTIAPGAAPLAITILLTPTTIIMKSVTVMANAAVTVDTRTGNQVFKKDDYHGSPTNTTSQIVQQSIAGAVRAPTGEVHIRGQHAEYTYYLDGVPVQPGISGGLNELFDPAVVNRIDFETGGWDAEYGGKNAAVINVLTRVPAGRFHAELSSYVGSFNSNGQTLNLSGNSGKWGWLVSGTRQETAMRQEPLVADPSTRSPINFHNWGHDLFGFGKLQFVPSAGDVFNLTSNWSRSRTMVPFDSTGGAMLDDRQQDVNSFINLSWYHLFPSAGSFQHSKSDLFAGVYYRRGSLDYMPGSIDVPSFIFYPDTNAYNLKEDRSFHTAGFRAYSWWHPRHEVEVKVGAEGSVTGGHELFVTTDADGNHGPISDAELKGHTIGVYAQSAVAPTEWVELRTGVRYDAFAAPFVNTQTQVSPRVKLSFFPNSTNTLFLYYGRMFMPTNIENLRAVTSVADSGVVAGPTLPERDDFYEAGYIRRFPVVVVKLSFYHKESLPGMDDNSVPGSAIVTSVNLGRVRVTGLEGAFEVHPPGPVSGYLNIAFSHAYGSGPITGGFFPADYADVPGRWFDLDHDQRISAVASAVFNQDGFYLNATGIYGSGLANGADISHPIKLGLFDANSDIHVDPNFILNASAGYSFALGERVVRPELYVDNIFNKKYALKGTFFSGASLGRPRSVQLRVTVGL